LNPNRKINTSAQIITRTLLGVLLSMALPLAAIGMSSSNYEVTSGTFNQTGGAGYSSNFTLSQGAIMGQPVQGSLDGKPTGELQSANYRLQSGLLDDGLAPVPSCELVINGGATITKDASVNLGLICSDSHACTEAAISNNGISWPSVLPYLQPYSTSTNWNLGTNDGEKRVFVKFKNSLGNWSGICSASIILDTQGPATSASLTSGTFMSSQAITLTSSESGPIYYTTNGNDPTAGSSVYSGPITLSANDTALKFFAVDAAGNSGQ